ncbi:MAG: hypothetical protein Q8Q42_04365 [Nanoarchaeota archaeon]|nr:hypothetical protein [Nanoarchaeota archaeon]
MAFLILVFITGCVSEDDSATDNTTVDNEEISDLNDEMSGFLDDIDDGAIGTEFEDV